MFRKHWLVYAVVCSFFFASLGFAEVRKVTREDIEIGNPDNTVTSAGGHVGHKISYSALQPTVIDVRDFGATGDDATDDTEAIQDAIDAAYDAGGGVVYFPHATYVCINLEIKDGVVLVGSPGGIGYLPSSIQRSKLLASGTGIVIDTPAGGATGAGVIGIDIQGLGADTPVKGIRIQAGSWNHIKNVMINNVSDEGIVILAGKADVIEDVLVVNAVLDRSQSAVIGAVDISGTDHYLHRVEATVSGSLEGTVQSANLYHVAIAMRGTNCFVTDCVGEISDIGVYVSGHSNRFTGVRADKNYGHGFYVTGGSNQFSNCMGMSNSQDTDNTYDNFHVTSGSANNIFSNCYARSQLTNDTRYGFYDEVASSVNKNQYLNCKSIESVTRQYINVDDGSIFSLPDGPSIQFTDGDTTPNVEGYINWEATYTNNTTITNFDNALYGQKIVLKAGVPGTITIEHGTNIWTNTGANKDLDPNMMYMFIKSGNFWFEL
jgi:hypothetical protein